jgi:hypothetical protein
MAVDWTKSMKQDFEYYTVDTESWLDRERLECIIESDISRDLNTETKHSFRAVTTEPIEECYIRVYMIATQGMVTEKIPLGTFLSYVPSIDYNGRLTKLDIEGYSPIIELREKIPPIGTYIAKNANIIETVSNWLQLCTRAPVIDSDYTCNSTKNYVAEISDTWYSFISGVLEDNGYFLNVDALGRIFIDKDINPVYLQPKWTFADGKDSILCNDISINQDIFDVPNVIEVSVSAGDENNSGFATARNNSPDSPVSTVNRGRIIAKRITNPQVGLTGLQDYAKSELIKESTVETSVTYSHGYCPVTIGDCIMLSHSRFGIDNMKLKVTSQSISCKTGCVVSETARSTVNLL